jgi:hypothetical protein
MTSKFILLVLFAAILPTLAYPAFAQSCPDGGGDLTVGNNQTLVINASISCNSITINSAGILLANSSDAGNVTIVIGVTGTLTINSGGTLSANYSGFYGGALNTAGFGPGGGPADVAGGGHGGFGGFTGGTAASGGGPYGSSLDPDTLGSGGAGSNARVGSPGGGSIKIQAATIVNNGNITADGLQGVSASAGGERGSGGGAGGSINIVTNSLSGGGIITARGGIGGTNGGGSTPNDAGGAGGHIMLSFNSSSFPVGRINVSGSRAGQPGTLALYDMDNDTLTILQGWRWVGSDRSVWNFTVINITGAVTRAVGRSVNFSLPTLLMAGSTIIGENASNTTHYNLTVNVSLFVMSQSNISNVQVANITAMNFSFLAGSFIAANGTGFLGGQPDVNGQGPGAGQQDVSGAGHGGFGGLAGVDATSGGIPYGSSLNPGTLGSGGGGGTGIGRGGAGGGLVVISAQRLVINGTINAIGLRGTNAGAAGDRGGGGGAGGSINIITGVLEGTGLLNASGGIGGNNGGASSTNGASGAGGRIMVRFNSTTFPIANTNVSGAEGSDPGTSGFLDMDDNILHISRGWRWQPDDLPVWNFTAINVTVANTRTNSSVNFSLHTLIFFRSSVIAERQQRNSTYNLTVNATTFYINASTIADVQIANITAVNFTMLAGSVLGGNGTGFPGSSATVNGQGPGGGRANGGGGGHGGIGGESINIGGGAYGSSLNPVTLGSGGAGGSGGLSPSVGGHGGGAVIIAASRVTVNGTINVTGRTGGLHGTLGSAGGGGGAGGSINIITDVFDGTGVLDASGGAGGTNANGNDGGGGGGGRIIVRFNSSSFQITRAFVKGGNNSEEELAHNGTLAFFSLLNNSLTIHSGWRWQRNDEPLFFANVSFVPGSIIRSDGAFVNISGTYLANNTLLTVEGNTTTINATALIMRNSGINASAGRIVFGYTSFDDRGTTYLNGTRLGLRNNSFSQALWLAGISAQVANLSTSTRLRENNIFVNTTAMPGLNRSANITMFGLTYADPVPIIDFADNSTFINCPAGRCTELSYSGGTFLFNVTGFTTFSTTGNVTGQEPEGQIIVSVQQVASLSFAINSINWGGGFLNTSLGNQVCVLDTEGSNSNSQCRNFSTVTQGLVLENDGSANLTVDLRSNATADQFIGGDSALNEFKWKISQNESGSCGNLTGPASYVDVNTTAPGTRICSTFFATGLGGLNFLNDADTLEIDINITIPYDALGGLKRALLVATGTAV